MRTRLALSLAISTLLFSGSAFAGTMCTLITDAGANKVIKQEGECDQRLSPASTFKIALSLMGFDSGFLVDTKLPALPFHEGYVASIASWRNTTDPTSWMKNSVVWYSQRLTEWLGTDRFQRYVTEFKYGNQDISGDKGKDNGLTNSWLSSSLKISPQEQTTFLRQIIHRQLKVSPQAYDMTDEILKVGTLPDGWEIRGKTGSGNALKADGTRDPDRQLGWFVGWAKKADKTVIFVRNIQDDKKQDSFASIRARESMMADLPAILSNQ